MDTSTFLFLLPFALLGYWRIAKMHRDYRTQILRERLFQLRSELFDYAADEMTSLHFDSDSYRLLNATLNAELRFAHRFSILQAIILMRGYTRLPKHAQKKVGRSMRQQAIASAPAGAEDFIRRTAFESHRAISLLLLTKPILLSLVFWTVVHVLVLRHKAKPPRILAVVKKMTEAAAQRADHAEGVTAFAMS